MRNLEANPEATIEVGVDGHVRTFGVRARVTRDEPERSALYARQVERRPGFADYVAKVDGIRTIPAVILEREDDRATAPGPTPTRARDPRRRGAPA